MNILVVEDNDIKFAILATFLREALTIESVTRAASYQSGLWSIVNSKFDWVILDMTLPVSDLELSPVGMDYLAFGGQYILRECRRRNISTKIIVVTQYGTFVRDEKEVSFNQLCEEIMSAYKDIVLGCIRLDRDSDGWKSDITSLLTK